MPSPSVALGLRASRAASLAGRWGARHIAFVIHSLHKRLQHRIVLSGLHNCLGLLIGLMTHFGSFGSNHQGLSLVQTLPYFRGEFLLAPPALLASFYEARFCLLLVSLFACLCYADPFTGGVILALFILIDLGTQGGLAMSGCAARGQSLTGIPHASCGGSLLATSLPLRRSPRPLLLHITGRAHMARQPPQRLAGLLVLMATWAEDPQGEPGRVIAAVLSFPRCSLPRPPSCPLWRSLRRILWRGMRHRLRWFLWRLMRRVLWLSLRWHAGVLPELPQLVLEAFGGKGQPLQGSEEERRLWHLLWCRLRRTLWCDLRWVGDEVPGGQQLLTTEAVLGVEVQAAGMDRPLEGAAVAVAQPCCSGDGEGLSHAAGLAVLQEALMVAELLRRELQDLGEGLPLAFVVFQRRRVVFAHLLMLHALVLQARAELVEQGERIASQGHHHRDRHDIKQDL